MATESTVSYQLDPTFETECHIPARIPHGHDKCCTLDDATLQSQCVEFDKRQSSPGRNVQIDSIAKLDVALARRRYM